MRTLTLKTDDSFFDKVTDLSSRLHLSKSELIRRAIVEYEKSVYRRNLKEQMKRASMKVRDVGTAIDLEFDDTIGDGLDDI